MDKKLKVKSSLKFDTEKQQPVLQQPETQLKQQAKAKKEKLKHSQKTFQISQRYITIAIPDSIVSNAQSSELRSYFMSQLARIFAIFQVDEVIILRDYSYISKSKQFDAASYVVRNLQYLETPQYLRKHLFPIHSDLKNVGLMNPIECKHHLLTEDVCQYREGVVVERPTKGDTSWVEIGLKKQVLIDYALQPGTRVTLKLDDPEADKLTGIPVSTAAPKSEGIYWGYSVTIESRFKRLLQNSNYDLKILIQSDNKDKDNATKDFIPQSLQGINKKILILFSGFQPITNFAENDEKSKLTSQEIYSFFDHSRIWSKIIKIGGINIYVFINDQLMKLQKIFASSGAQELNQSFQENEPPLPLIDFYSVDLTGRNLLHRASLQQNSKLIAEILTEYRKQQQPNIYAYLNTPDKFGLTAVQMCCFSDYNDRFACLKLFIDDADLNRCNPRTLWTIAHWISHYGDKECIQLLLDKEAIFFIMDYEGRYPLDLAGLNNKKHASQMIIEWMVQFLFDYEKSRLSIKHNNLRYDRFCEYDKYISNPALKISLFYWSCYFKFTIPDIVPIRFYPLAPYLGKSALHVSIISQNMIAFDYLIEKAKYKQPLTHTMLLSKNATPQNNRIFSIPPELLKIYKKKYQQYIVNLDQFEYDYLQNELNFSLLEQIDEFGNTPLHLAAISNNIQMITLLIQSGCKIDVQNGEFWMPCDLTTNEEAKELFLQRSKSKRIKNIKNFILTCDLPTQQCDINGKQLMFQNTLNETTFINNLDNLFFMSTKLILPDYVIKCNVQQQQKVNFLIQVLINARFEVFIGKSISNSRILYIMLTYPDLQMQAMIQQIQVKLLNSYDYEPFNMQEQFEPFRSYQRQQIIEEYLKKIINIEELTQQKVILDSYRMHSYGGTSKIRKKWLNPRKWFLQQPFSQIWDYLQEGIGQDFQSCTILRLYFGEKIGYFFAFKSYITCFMLFIAFPGLILQIYILISQNFNTLIAPLFAIYTSIWSTITFEFWKRKQSEMNTRWGLLDQMNEEELQLRIEFIGDEYMNMITQQVDKYEKKGHSIVIFIFSIPVLILFSAIIVGLFISVDYFQREYTNNSYSKLIVGVVQGISISALNIAYTALVHYFVSKENHKYEQNYEGSLIYKSVLFKLVNSYISVFYTAFVRIDSSYEEIFYILLPVLIIKQLSYLVAALIIPQFIYKFKENGYFKRLEKIYNRELQYQDPIDKIWKESTQQYLHSITRPVLNISTGQNEANIDMDSVELNGLKLQIYKQITLNYFMESLIDLGFVTLFAAAFPIGSAIAVLLNIIEIRMKVYSFNSVYRRVQASRTAGIGSDWLLIWEFINFSGIFTNYALIFLKQGDQINQYLFPNDQITRTNMLWLFLLAIFCNVLLKYGIQQLIPDKPTWVIKSEEELKNKKKQHSEVNRLKDDCRGLQIRMNKLERQNNNLKQQCEEISFIEQERDIQQEQLNNTSQVVQNSQQLNLLFKSERDILLQKFRDIQQLIQSKQVLLIICADCQQKEATDYCVECQIQYCKNCSMKICHKHQIIFIPKNQFFKLYYYQLPTIGQQLRIFKNYFNILEAYYDGYTTDTSLLINDEHFNIDDKFISNRLYYILMKKGNKQPTFEEFIKQVNILQKSTFEQRIILLLELIDITQQNENLINQEDYLNFLYYFFVQDTSFTYELRIPKVQTKKDFIREVIRQAQHQPKFKDYLNCLLQI